MESRERFNEVRIWEKFEEEVGKMRADVEGRGMGEAGIEVRYSAGLWELKT